MRVGEHETSARERAVLLHVKELVHPHQFQTWFRNVSLEEAENGSLRLRVPNPFVRDWISNYYIDILAAAARKSFGEDRALLFQVDPQSPAPAVIEEAAPAAVATAPPAPMAPAALVAPVTPAAALGAVAGDTALHEDYTFENFVVGSSNRFGHAAAIAVADSPGRSYNPFFLHGSVGLGKTHLLQAICHRILSNRPASNILYLSCEAFTNHFIAALENNDLAHFRQKYRNVDLLLVDDIHLLANKERTQEEFFHTFNTLYNLGRQIVLSSDAPPKDIPTLQERLVSRFKMGLVVEIAPPDFETRVSILKRKAKLRDCVLSDEVLQFLAEHVSTNIRELEGAVIRLIGYSSLVGRPIDLELAHEAMQDGGAPRRAAVTIHDVVLAVTRYFNVKLSDLQSKRRTQSIARPRQICMYLARKLTTLSLEEIGGYFGGRDHTTVIYAIDKVTQSANENSNEAELLRLLRRQIDG